MKKFILFFILHFGFFTNILHKKESHCRGIGGGKRLQINPFRLCGCYFRSNFNAQIKASFLSTNILIWKICGFFFRNGTLSPPMKGRKLEQWFDLAFGQECRMQVFWILRYMQAASLVVAVVNQLYVYLEMLGTMYGNLDLLKFHTFSAMR